jgi:NACalpha-BTF3-like transcription factor
MAKKCLVTYCKNNSCSHGYCWNHQYLRIDEKYVEQLRKKIQKKTERAFYIVKNPIKVKMKSTGVKRVFEEIIREREHISWLTKKPISNPTAYNCAHVIPKGNSKYKKYCSMDKDDIVLLINEEHDLFDKGTVDSRTKYAIRCKEDGYECDWNRLTILAKLLVKKYDEIRILNNDKKY